MKDAPQPLLFDATGLTVRLGPDAGRATVSITLSADGVAGVAALAESVAPEKPETPAADAAGVVVHWWYP